MNEELTTSKERCRFTVRGMPYRTHENRIDGVVITFADITVAKNLEAALRKAQSDLEERFTHQTVELGKARKNLHAEVNQHPRTKPDEGRTSGSDRARKSRAEKPGAGG